MKIRILLLLSAVLASTAFAAYTIPWFTVDAGGGSSSAAGGGYTVRGTIGQADAAPAVMTGGAYRVTGGFWPDVRVIANGGPPLTIRRTSATTYTLRWAYPSTGWRVQHSTNLQTWIDSDTSSRTQVGAEWQWSGTIVAGTPKLFFRLVNTP